MPLGRRRRSGPWTRRRCAISSRICTACTTRPFGNSLATVPFLGDAGYIGITALALNVTVTVIGTVVLRALKVSNGTDITSQKDYFADVGDPGVRPVVSPADPVH